MSRRHAAARPDNRPYGVVTIPPDPDPPPPSGFIPANATWWFDRSLMTNTLISLWNNKAVEFGYIGSPHYTVDLTSVGMPGNLRLKNELISKPRCVAGGTWKGAMNCMRAATAHADPNGGPPYKADGADDNPAYEIKLSHAMAQATAAGGALVKPSYGQYFDVGMEILFPSLETSAAAFDQPKNPWTILLQLNTSEGRTTECWSIRANHYDKGRRFFLQSGYSTGVGTYEEETFWSPAGVGKRPPEPEWGYPWEFDTLYQLRIRGVVDKRGAAYPDGHQGWCDLYVNGELWAFARRVQSGKADDNSVLSCAFPTYSGYTLSGSDRTVYVTQAYIVLGATGFPQP